VTEGTAWAVTVDPVNRTADDHETSPISDKGLTGQFGRAFHKVWVGSLAAQTLRPRMAVSEPPNVYKLPQFQK